MMYLVQDTQKASDWLFRVINDNGITAVLAVGFLILAAINIIAFAKYWVVPASAIKAKDLQIEALNAILAAQEATRTDRVEARLEKLEDTSRDNANMLGAIRDDLRRIETRGVGQNAGQAI